MISYPIKPIEITVPGIGVSKVANVLRNYHTHHNFVYKSSLFYMRIVVIQHFGGGGASSSWSKVFNTSGCSKGS